MIEKRGNKTDRPVLMEHAVPRFIEKKYELEMSPEVRLYNGGYADLCGWIKDKNDEIRDFIVVEIKQSHNDFYSGYGLNFVGMSNYIAVPPELVGFSIEFLREEGFGFVGVLEVDSRCFVREVIQIQIVITRKQDIKNQWFGILFRRFTYLRIGRKGFNDRNFTGHFYRGAIHFRHRLFRLFCNVPVRADDQDVAGAEMIEALIIGVFILLGSLFLIFLWEVWK